MQALYNNVTNVNNKNFCHHRNIQASTASLCGMPELPRPRTWKLGILDAFVAGDIAEANRMRENSVTITPHCKLLTAGNKWFGV